MNSNGETIQTETTTPPDETTLVWTVWLLKREHPLRAVAALALVVLALYAGMHVVDNAFVVGLYAVILLAAIGEFLFPVRYRLSPDGASATSWYGRIHIPWSRIRRLQRDDKGLKVSVYQRDTLLDRFRGMYLRFEDNADEVLALARRFARGGDRMQ